MDFDSLKITLNELLSKFETLKNTLKLDDKKQKIDKLEKETLKDVSALLDQAFKATKHLDKVLKEAEAIEDFEKAAFYYRDEVIPAMSALRTPCDELETLTAENVWPFPTYGKLLFGIL